MALIWNYYKHWLTEGYGLYLRVLLILKRSGRAAGQTAKDVTAKSSISSSLVLLLYCPQPFPPSLYCEKEWRKKKNLLFLVRAPVLQSTPSVPHYTHTHTHTHTHEQHTSCQVKAGSEEATAPDTIRSDWAPEWTNKVTTFLSWWHTLCNRCVPIVFFFFFFFFPSGSLVGFSARGWCYGIRG